MIHLPDEKDLKRYRKTHGLTQQELAEKASVSQSLIARIEAGTVDPRLSTVRKIINVINDSSQKELKAINAAVTKDVITISDTDPIGKASELMFSKGFSQIPVCDANGRVIGAIKEKTITINLMKSGVGILSKPIKEIMIKEDALPMLPLTASLKSIESLLVQHGHAAVLLMDEGQIVGILTKADVIRTYLR